MSEFEKYLSNNKAKMQVDHPDEELWSKIEERMKTRQPRLQLYIKSITAIAAVLLLGIVINQFLIVDTAPKFPEELLAEYGFREQNLDADLDYKISLIRKSKIPTTYENDFLALYAQVKYLDKTFNNKLQYLKTNGTEGSIAKEVLGYYKAKNSILDKLIYEIDRIEKNEIKYHTESEKKYLKI